MAPSPGPQLDSYAIELQALEDYRNFSATTIQRYYRGWIVRHRRAVLRDAQLQQQQAAKSAAAVHQRLYKAARTIQDAWRRYNNKRIYRFYRDLIKFREAADPRQILRSINAREAALIDPAAGLHVRFRLGGSSFPPLVFYKIYTHRPVTDIGAFGPRNYASEDAAVHSPAAPHNKQGSIAGKQQQYEEYELPAKHREYLKPDGTVGYRSTKSWYCRVDCNGWRPVAERLLLDQQHQAALPPAPGSSSSGAGILIRRRQQRRRAKRQQQQQRDNAGAEAGSSQWENQEAGSSQSEDEGEITGSSGRSSPLYHYSPLVRREERARKLKQRRRQWLLKMYRTGMQNAAAGADTADETGSNNNSLGNVQLQGDNTAVQQPPKAAAAGRPSSRPSRDSDSEEQLLQLLERKLLEDTSASGNGVGKAANSIAAAAGGADVASDADWDIDELVSLGLDAGILAWTRKLDFDTYQQQWNNTAVTLGSEAAVPVSELQLLQQLQQQEANAA